jgi:2-hydroxychromene-2-carboxylate isomerase
MSARPRSPIEFWFDFSSGYAYFAAFAIDAVAQRHGRTVAWRPYMLGVAFKRTGARGLSGTPIKGDYARHDWARLAKLTGLRFAPPANHPITALPASRAYYWVEANHPDVSHEFARRAFHAYFAEGQDLTQPAHVADIGSALGLPASALESAIGSDPIKQKVRDVTEEALGKGVFGSPFFLVDGEPFWGWDRIPMLEQWLASNSEAHR